MNLGDPIAPSSLPHDWQFGLVEPASAAMARMADLFRLQACLAGAALLLLLAALFWIAVRYNVRAHPTADRHRDDGLALAGFVGVAVVVLVLAAIPALRLAAQGAAAPPAFLTVEAVGNVGHWTYVYSGDNPGDEEFRFDSRRLDKAGAARTRQPAMMAVDLPLVVPVGRPVVVLVTSADVGHVWSVPALGVGGDAIPGRVSRLWFKAERPGLYYGLCAEACGAAGTIAPVAVKAVSEEEYRGWLAFAKREYADGGVARFAAR